MDRGLWRYTRHPNYFGDAAQWWGFALIAFAHWPGILTIASPALMTWFLARKTGKPLLESHLTASRPGYRRIHRGHERLLPAAADAPGPTRRSHRDRATRRSVAVVGAGVSGLTAAWILQRDAEVTLYEALPRLGGHAHTHDVPVGDRHVAVDSGFIVHNQRTYPNLLRLFAELGVETRETEMSMSVRCDGCGLEYAGSKGLGGVFAHAKSLRNPAYLRMLTEVKRFHIAARRLLRQTEDTPRTLEAFLREGSYSRYFIQHFMVPVVSCVWSCSPGTALMYPARYLFQFLDHHGLLSVSGLADLAHSRRRVAHLRRASHQRTHRRSHSDPGSSSHPNATTASRSGTPTGGRTGTTRSSSPRMPTRRWRCSPTPRLRSGGFSAPSPTR